MKAGLFTIIAIVLIMSGMTLIVMGFAPKEETIDLNGDQIPDDGLGGNGSGDYTPPDYTNGNGDEPPPDGNGNGDEPPPDGNGNGDEPPPEPPPDYEYPPFVPSVKLPRLDLPDIDVNMQIVGFVLVLVGLVFLSFPSKGW